MSLTTLLKNKEVKTFFSDSFKKPRGKIESDIKEPVLTDKPNVIGNAFDYLMRFYLKYHNPGSLDKQWIAEVAFKLMQKNESTDFWKQAQMDIDSAKDNYNKFMGDGIITNELLKSTIKLANLDFYYRGGRNAYGEISITDNDIQDLRNLINLVDIDKFKVDSHCLLNPVFNEASLLVRGADADIVIDDKMIDIKTTKNLKVTRDMFNQIIGYYILGYIDGIGENRLDINNINKIGFYFSRYGILHLYNVENIIDLEKLPEYKSRFMELAEKYEQSR